MKRAPRLEKLPKDVLLQILDRLDSKTLREISTVCKSLSEPAVRQMWHSAECRTLNGLDVLLTSLESDVSYYDYRTFLVNLRLIIDKLNQPLPGLKIKTLWIERANALPPHILDTVDVQHICFSHCHPDTILSIFNHASACQPYKLLIYDCPGMDMVIHSLFLPQSIKEFSYCRSGFISDRAIETLAQQCPLIETLILTLPKNIIQANTMTLDSLLLLTQFKHLKVLVCKGQIRISKKEHKNWLYSHIPSLEYCDLSFNF
ncbi:hypothetical protein BY458DRAFT_524614 [Sporodiniella umbellata]|nr:hypothetical protein BY458DRAFT_524614 [Sporodiniella umbellata]